MQRGFAPPPGAGATVAAPAAHGVTMREDRIRGRRRCPKLCASAGVGGARFRGSPLSIAAQVPQP
eukprot:5069298-Lingulodinium_polyedra.AAC.1